MISIFSTALLLRIILSFGPFHPDLGNHLDWGIKFWTLGPKYFYENLFWQVSWPNQPPGTIYTFALIRKIYEAIFGLVWWLNIKIPSFPSILVPFFENKLYVSLVKLPSILADLGIGLLICKFVKELKNSKVAKVAATVFLFNPVSWYNSAVWGQTDALINFFGLWSIYLYWKKKPILATFVFLSSFYFKGSLLIFTPIILILLAKSETAWWKKVMVVLIFPVVLAYLSFPFVRWLSPIPWLYHLYIDRIFGHQGNMLTANAFNLWALFFGIDFSVSDLGSFLGLTFKSWGQILFVTISAPVLVALLVKKFKIENVLFSVSAIAMFSFLFLTNMHERYLYPAIPCLSILMFIVPKMKVFYALLCLVFMVNLYNLWFVPDPFGVKVFFTPSLIKFFSLFNLFLLPWFLWIFLRFLRSKKI